MPIKTDRSDFKIQKEHLEKKKRTFRIHRKRGTRIIYMGASAVAISKEKRKSAIKDKELNKEVINLIANVAKNINKFIVESGFDIEEVEERHGSTWTNRELYEALEDRTKFYYIDISHCFWRISFLKGYISEYMYNSILQKPHLKTYRNMALACIKAPEEVDYYDEGVHILTISEDKSLHARVYDNIRFTSYNLMGDITSAVGAAHVVGYRTDGIMVLPDFRDDVIHEILSKDFNCNVFEVEKVDDYYYRYEDGTKKHL
jgi:hypothetical protein